jgi:very-short-patch-repair endonuclease
MKRKVLPYRPRFKTIARTLRKEMTLAEVLLWNELKRKQMMGYDFHRQKPIDKYVVDFFCPRLSLVIEIDGASHEEKQEADSKRQKEIERYGISFLRFSDHEVKQNLDGVLESLREWIAAREDGKGKRRV